MTVARFASTMNETGSRIHALHRWLAVLVAPGASLGGARPKANFTEADGSLWIAKFSARDDERDVGAWEYVVLATRGAYNKLRRQFKNNDFAPYEPAPGKVSSWQWVYELNGSAVT